MVSGMAKENAIACGFGSNNSHKTTLKTAKKKPLEFLSDD